MYLERNTDKIIHLTIGGVEEARSQQRRYKHKRRLIPRNQRQLEVKNKLGQEGNNHTFCSSAVRTKI